ncbi:MAG: cytochrome c [Leptospiraceae bacterium]|nr:cytochrome c [Leptospiraceae bacterium]
MSRWVKILFIALAVVFFAIAGGVAYLFAAFPYNDYPDISVSTDAGTVERGRYLANHVTVCVDCHSERDWMYFSGPIKPGTEGRGGERFGHDLGFPGEFYARNITPAALKDWSDQDIGRAIVSGVSQNGRPFFPVMPYPAYANLKKSDLASIIAYLRTLHPIDHTVSASSADFPMNLILRTIPGEYHPMDVDDNDPVSRGKYLVTVAGCAECHTPADKGKKLPGMDLAGGFPFPFPDGSIVRSANITPDVDTGIGGWDEKTFVQRFKKYDPSRGYTPAVQGEMNTYMPWTMYSGMTESDLKDMYAYLRTVKPVKNPVRHFTASQK